MDKKSPLFECAPECQFESIWIKHDFESAEISDFHPPLYVLPRTSIALSDKLQAIETQAETIVLNHVSDIILVKEIIAVNKERRIVFICESNWQNGIDESSYALFLSLIQGLSRQITLKLDIVTCCALYNPYISAVTHPLDAVYIGLGQTLAKEIPSWQVRQFNLDEINEKNIKRINRYSFQEVADSPIHIVEDVFYVSRLTPTTYPKPEQKTGFKQKGCYLIIGGLGGLGMMLTDYLIAEYDAKLIVVGRRPATDEHRHKYENKSVHFEAVDITDPSSLEDLFLRHPDVNGIIHSALVLDDASLLSMSDIQLKKVLAPKITGTYHLINAIRQRQFDFVMFFSSIQSFIANAGQANYTAACAGKDVLAHMLQTVFLQRAHIINWGYWGDRGVVANDFYRERMAQLEVSSIDADTGLALIEQVLQNDIRQIVMLKASSRALARMGIQTSILPTFDVTHPLVERNRNAVLALEQYARHQWCRSQKPNNVIPTYQALWEAVSTINETSSPDKTELLRQYPEISGHVKLLDTCLLHFAEIVSGQVNPLSIMFPEGSFSLVEPVYKDNPIADYYNEQVANTVVNYIVKHQRINHRPIRILEIGAGTGSTSEKIIPRIEAYNVRYVYSDLSHAFLNKARRKFSSYGFVDYEIYNVEDAYKEKNCFDVVVATNVIHATSDIHQAVHNVYELLSDEGIFILNEITARQDYATLTFGLTEGWWLSQDELRIPNSPLLSEKAWEQVLKACHFESVKTHGEEGQHVIVGDVGGQRKRQEILPQQKESGRAYEQVKLWLKGLISDVMHLPIDEIEDNVPFSEYGIDSLIALELLSPMKDRVGYVPATILFECPTLKQLTSYFEEEYISSFLTEDAGDHIPLMDVELSVKQGNDPDIIGSLKHVIADTMHMPLDELDLNTPLSEFGIDSLISLEILKPLQDLYGYLPATLLFEHPTIASLATYLESKSMDVESKESNVQASKTTKHNNHSEQAMQDNQGLNDAVAIIGVASQLPKAKTKDIFWSMLAEAKHAYSKVPFERWNVSNKATTYTNTGAFIDNIDVFDHEFFNITPLDAEKMDPQERVFLQTTYHAIQDAGLCFEELSGKEVGCYVGVMNHGYDWLTPENSEDKPPTSLFWSIANRASYHFNWRGPSFAIDSACSSSLTALHTAVSGLKQGDCQLAVVGGVNLIVHPRQMELLCQLHMLSPTESCKPFGKDADGFVDGEGVVTVVLKRYQDALAAGDNIYGIIRGSSVNTGGKSNGYSAPNPEAQKALIEKTLARSNLRAHDISYVEAHGTGTELGDPIEIRALSQAFSGVPNQSVALGSVKGNIGHLESAAGLSGVLKVLMQMKHKKILPSIHSTTENPHLNLVNTPFYINKSLLSWADETPMRACISSFGAGGANAHCIIESYSPDIRDELNEPRTHYFFPLSAHTRLALYKEMGELLHVLDEDKIDLNTLSYGYCCVRSRLRYRAGLVVSSQAQLCLELKNMCASFNSAIHGGEYDVGTDMQAYQQSGKKDMVLAQRLMAAFNAGESILFNQLFDNKLSVRLPEYPFDMHRHWVNAKETNFNEHHTIMTHHQILEKQMAPAAYALSCMYEEGNINVIQSVVWKSIICDLKRVKRIRRSDSFCLKDSVTGATFAEAKVQQVDLKTRVLDSNEMHGATSFIKGETIYQTFKEKGYCYGPYYQAIQWAVVGKKSVRSLIEVSQDWQFVLSPALIDAALQTAILMEDSTSLPSNQLMVPFYIEKIMIYQDVSLGEAVFCTCSTTQASSMRQSSVTYDITLSNHEGMVLIDLVGVVSVPTSMKKLIDDSSSHVKISERKLNVYELN